MNAASQNLFLPPPALDLSRVRYLPATERHQIPVPPHRKSYITKFAPSPLQLLFSARSREGTSSPPPVSAAAAAAAADVNVDDEISSFR